MTSRLFRLLPVMLLLSAGTVSASKSSISIVLDAVAIPIAEDSVRVLILAAIPKGTPGSTGPLLASVRARDDHSHTLAQFERVEAASRDTMGDRILSWYVPGKAGKIEARVRLRTLDDREDTGSAEVKMNVPAFSKDPFYVSTPWLVAIPRDSAADENAEYRYVPSRIIRRENDILAIRATAFVLVQSKPRRCNVNFILRRGSQQITDSTFTHDLMPRTMEIRVDPMKLGGGQYKYQLTFWDGSGLVKREGTFQITVGGADLLRDPVLVRTVLGYIASGEERLAIETAPEDSLSAVWDRFWKRRDPSPDTGSNEALDRFLDRVDQATNRFGGVVPGWRSDRGRILIQHGDPERTERVFDPSTRTDTEIWYYDQRNMSYVFQDAEGFGNYKLTGGQ